MIIRIEERQPGASWMVRLDALCVGFKSLEQAQAFTRTLQARIDAPHVWPQGAFFRPGIGRDVPATSPRMSAQMS
ncbi:hypothetical protein [Pseudomonas sp. OA65]|uniref:hypothetical protein n=1 Tax=Pseudomonas sp. OA65 TaxID=2818431 RepID=UPI001A9DC6A4|nr:hypothetical protein [Pseudomonas sp. OA65]MBO1537311.1 hypothetical protein [Pseudomonas sp. OA65]